ncbi:FecR domain-containing protein [Parabacteroides faecis]
MDSRYSLTIRNESKEEILKMLSILVRIDYTIKDDTIVLYKI